MWLDKAQRQITRTDLERCGSTKYCESAARAAITTYDQQQSCDFVNSLTRNKLGPANRVEQAFVCSRAEPARGAV
jgi:hypothetical protein